jgi:DNA-binding GntR family transcriptional regulator
VISLGTEAASEVLAGTLGISAGTQVYVFERLRYADAEHGTFVLSQRQQWSVDAVRS